ncbi:hypothetical protein ADK52_14030 [Streptomyces sp. WM6372]|nr:hypothetical protein ADK52_14030 [Streptomyces sp. WM6372]
MCDQQKINGNHRSPTIGVSSPSGAVRSLHSSMPRAVPKRRTVGVAMSAHANALGSHRTRLDTGRDREGLSAPGTLGHSGYTEVREKFRRPPGHRLGGADLALPRPLPG